MTSMVLLVEDEQSDAYLIEWAFKNAVLACQLRHLRDGQEALDYFSGTGIYADRAQFPIPEAVLLDLKMPRLTGFDVLEWLAQRAEFQSVKVVVLSSSDYPEDIRRARKLGAVDFLVKPGSLRVLVEMIRDVECRWLKAPSQAPSLEKGE